MWKKATLLTLVLLFSFLFFPSAKAQEPAHWLELNCNEPFYYVKGDVIQVNATSNASVSVTLSVFWNWRTLDDNELIYQNTKTTNASWNLPTDNQRAGFYKIVASTENHTVTIWRTLIHLTDWIPESLPFSHTWQGINYTLEGRTLRAETEEDFIEIVYPKIPFQHSTGFYRNNMSFLVRLQGATWAVDLLYFTIHSGLKWAINGTLDNPETFEFQCSHNPLVKWKRTLDRFQSENFLVFDWADLAKAKKAFSWNATTKILSVTIPSSFDIDPSILLDGFEGAPYAAWTGTNVGGSSILEQSSTTAHHGVNSSHVSAAAWQNAYCYHDSGLGLGDETRYARFYVNFTNIGSGLKVIGRFYTESIHSSNIISTVLVNSSHWCLEIRDSGGTYSYDYWDTAPSLNTWYCVEFNASRDSGKTVALWIDGTIRASLTDDFVAEDIGIFVLGAFSTTDVIEMYQDCVVVDTEYIGPEEEEGEFSYVLQATGTCSTNILFLKETIHYSGETGIGISSLTWGKEKSFPMIGTGTITEGLRILQEKMWLPSETGLTTTTIILGIETLEFFAEIAEAAQATGIIATYIERLWSFDNPVTVISQSQIGLETGFVSYSILETLLSTAQAYLTIESITVYTLDDIAGFAAIAFIIALAALCIALLAMKER